MPIGKKNSSRAFKIGLATLISLFLLFFGINFLKGSKIFEKTAKYYIVFPNSGGLNTSSAVVINGYKVGKVTKLDFDYKVLGDIIVEITVNDDLALPRGTTGVVTRSLMGGSSVRLDIPHTRTQGLHTFGDTIAVATSSASNLFDTVEKDIAPSVMQVTQQLDTLLAGLNKIVNAPQIPLTIEAINGSAQSLRSTTARLNALMHHKVPMIVDNLETSSASISDVSRKINQVEFEAVLTDFTRVVADLKQFSGRLNEKDNSLGLLLNDPILYDQLTRASKSADSLLIDIRSNPKRYVHFSIF